MLYLQHSRCHHHYHHHHHDCGHGCDQNDEMLQTPLLREGRGEGCRKAARDQQPFHNNHHHHDGGGDEHTDDAGIMMMMIMIF